MELAKPPTARQMDRRRRILESTRDLLAEGGYEGLQMRVLAERAGVSPMTLYNRFGNKDDLILTALQEMLGGLRGEAWSLRGRTQIRAVGVTARTKKCLKGITCVRFTPKNAGLCPELCHASPTKFSTAQTPCLVCLNRPPNGPNGRVQAPGPAAAGSGAGGGRAVHALVPGTVGEIGRHRPFPTS